MSLIQVILLFGILLIFISYFRWFRSAAIDIMVIGIMCLTGIVFILFPEITNRIAAVLGVGRGTDLLFYLSVIGFGFMLLLLYSRIRKLERQFTELVRRQAIKDSLEKEKVEANE